MKGHLVIEVIENSIAEEAGIEVGDTLLSINDKAIEDALDYHLFVDNDELTLTLTKGDSGEVFTIEIEKDEEEDLGLVFANNLMDEYKSCRNKCVFCFIDQLPQGMRETLYFKDDDARLSFLQGNYVTLTNMKDHDIDRIIEYHLSPINISVHTMNLELRKKMLNNRFAGNIKGYLGRLFEAGTLMNGQIVLCKGINDGKEFEDSVQALSAYIPHLQSISVVPVGLSKHREGLAPLEPFTEADAKSLIKTVEKWQNTLYNTHGTHFIHAGDEFYFLAGQEMPLEDTYDGYLQLENGVGMTRLLIDEFTQCYNDFKSSKKKRKLSIGCGTLIEPIIIQLMALLKNKCPNYEINIYPITNHFFGERITVSGLLTGKDILSQLKGIDLGEKLLLPSNLLRDGEEVLLDDLTVSDLENALGIKVQIVGASGYELLEAVTG